MTNESSEQAFVGFYETFMDNNGSRSPSIKYALRRGWNAAIDWMKTNLQATSESGVEFPEKEMWEAINSVGRFTTQQTIEDWKTGVRWGWDKRGEVFNRELRLMAVDIEAHLRDIHRLTQQSEKDRAEIECLTVQRDGAETRAKMILDHKKQTDASSESVEFPEIWFSQMADYLSMLYYKTPLNIDWKSGFRDGAKHGWDKRGELELIINGKAFDDENFHLKRKVEQLEEENARLKDVAFRNQNAAIDLTNRLTELERLRKALEKISNYTPTGHDSMCQDIAKEALTGNKG